MHIITQKALREFAASHPDVESALQHWYQLMKHGNFQTLVEVKAIFPSADQVDDFTVFNIGGNKVRLITNIRYNRQKVYIVAVLTHAEYNKNKWRE